jgi:hypothetical protein
MTYHSKSTIKTGRAISLFLFNITTMSTEKIKLIHRINALQTEVFDRPVSEEMFDWLLEQSEGGLSGIVLALLMIRQIRREDTP